MKPQGIGKSPKKWGKQKLNKSPPPKGVQTITAMFKQQSAGVSRGSTSMSSNIGQDHSSDNSDSDDVTVVKVESQYFEKSGKNDDSEMSIPESTSPFFKKKRSSSRLRLKQSVSKKLLEDEVVKVDSEIKAETADNEESPSQKENTCNVNSDNGESSLKVGRSIRLSLGKRKLSEDLEDFVTEDKKKRNETKLLKKQIMNKSERQSSTSVDHHKSKAPHKIRKVESSKSVKCSSRTEDGTTRDTNVQRCMRDTEVKDASKHACASGSENKTSSKELTVATVEPISPSTSCESLLKQSDCHDHSQIKQNISEKQIQIKKTKMSNSRRDPKLDIKECQTQDSQSIGTVRVHSQSESQMENSKTTDSQTMDSQTVDSQTTDSQTESVGEDLKEKYKTPYYHENFKVIMTTVLGESDYQQLFNEEDMKFIGEFQTCSESAQKLYIRLFSRKLTWLPLTRIKYPEIEDDLTPVVTELAQHQLVQTAEGLTDLQVTLNILSAGDLKTLAKTYHINVTNQNKPDIIQLLIKKSRQSTIGSMFKVAGCGGSSTMLNRAKKLLGCCLHLMEEPRTVFLRMLMLFSLNDTILDEDNGTGSQGQQLFQMLQVNIGRLVYPGYKVNKSTSIFGDRDTFLRFATAVTMESDILTRLEKKDFDRAFDIYQSAEKQYDKQLQDQAIQSHDESLPVFLRSYTACGVFVRVLNQGVEILQRRKDYTQAVQLLEKLLSQQIYCVTYRGHWWERLAINYDAHLKQPAKALKCIGEGLEDEYLRTGHRLAVFQRAEKICTAPKSKFKDQLLNFHHEPVLDYPEVFLDGKVLPDNVPGARFRFLMSTPGSEGDPDDLTFCGVEQLVMEHYRQNGYTDGLHAEGSTVSSLFTLFFWDMIYRDIPDAFHSNFQVMPLDFHSDHFYSSRQDKIDQRLDTLRHSSVEELHQMVSDVWEQHEGEMCGMSWDRFSGVDHAKGLVSCFGGKVIAGILERYACNPRQTRGGFPDLTLWNTDNKTVKICEVKGPGDRLSHKQILWLSYLISLGVDTEVCYVKAVSTKKLKH
ncbi:fanconi-associated nuclease 1-like isoform X2 [Mizuhopecten yessoensis]|nr:fanconi-associated nuclease 1-like isoform X2 [Mizuhopecten yessoensis]XP_021345967.1 fanconi-associated nuclease 1-like isoform X2 [Mizuhopecten yessoensis]